MDIDEEFSPTSKNYSKIHSHNKNDNNIFEDMKFNDLKFRNHKMCDLGN